MPEDPRPRLQALQARAKRQGLSQAEWWEAAALLRSIGQIAEAEKCEQRARAAVPAPPRQRPLEPEIPAPRVTVETFITQAHQPSPVAPPRVGLCGGCLVVGVIYLVLVTICSLGSSTTSGQSEEQAHRSNEIRNAASHHMDLFRQTCASTGVTPTLVSSSGGIVHLRLTLPMLMDELHAKEVATATLNHWLAVLPRGATVMIDVESPAGQRLAHVYDRSL